jgi:hypothetical protein
MEEIAKGGATIDHVRWDGAKIYHETYSPPKKPGRKAAK